MARSQTVKVKGLREFVRASDRAGKETKQFVRESLAPAGDIVREEWANRFRHIDDRSAAGLRTRVRVGNVAVQQSLRKVTGKRPDYGAHQMRYGIESLADKRPQVEAEFLSATDRVLDHFDKKGV